MAHFDARVSPEMSIPLTNTSNGNLAPTQTNTRPDDIRKRVIGGNYYSYSINKRKNINRKFIIYFIS